MCPVRRLPHADHGRGRLYDIGLGRPVRLQDYRPTAESLSLRSSKSCDGACALEVF